ncbi:FcoT family thioesterase [Streptomyces sp. NPDC003023]|uniref:FcoT family thioesterase n=1 Tax=Streptomyces sp. NPDC003023 TaxID=3364675 RepID=UPI0036BA8FC9
MQSGNAKVLHPPNRAAEPDLLAKVLHPYKENCRYLESAIVDFGAESGLLEAHCEFRIPESCYIADTGHFNAVEFNICYNQMAYILIAEAVHSSLLDPFSAWTLDEYWKRQLPNVLIADFHSRFRRPMKSAAFRGVITLNSLSQRSASRPLIILDTSCSFEDGDGGRAEGEAKLVITDPPHAARGSE